ncbi:MAG: cytochrome b N-terminal domain-containing protein, partial [Candidatus Eremiobacteraeota bacterium]|nr:cytochrome b N-terminal domain-containing protein [Candidatus Eremiobacteraeota bacterium]
ATLFAMMVQIITGIFLTFFYAPSAMTAWESTKSIYDHPFQHLVLSIHYWGASAMIALVFLHLLQVVIWGAYKSPREIQWIVGVLLLLVTMVLGLTGYLLPWDMNAYFASQVAINLTLNVPIVGTFVQQFAQDGTTLGTLTINRFFGLHVWLMPAVLVALVGAHLAIFRWNGPAGPPVEDPRPLRPGRFWPDQMFMDAAASLIIFIIIFGLALAAPPFLDAKADPTKFFVPYPAWYFLDLFGLLNLVPGNLEIVGAIIIPGVATLILFVLPWLDRSTTRVTGSRKPILWLLTVSMAVILGLTFWSQAGIVAKQAAAASIATPTTAQLPAPANAQANAQPAGGALSASAQAGKTVFAQNCSSCHGATGAGVPGTFPALADNPVVTGDPKKVVNILLNGLQGHIQVGSQSFNGQMPAWKANLSAKDITNVINFIRTGLGNNKATQIKQSLVTSQKK